ncbi:MAG: phage head closure protein [Pseudomonas sp.]
MSFTAQELNTRIEFQRLELGEPDPLSGYQTEEWTTYASAFAKVEPLVGREYIAAMAERAENNIKVTIRYQAGIKPVDRLVLAGEAWDIKSVQNIKFRNRELLLYCKRI